MTYHTLKTNHKDTLYVCDFNGFFVTSSKDKLDVSLEGGIYFISREVGGTKYQVDLYKDITLNDNQIEMLVEVSNDEIRERMLFNLEGDFG